MESPAPERVITATEVVAPSGYTYSISREGIHVKFEGMWVPATHLEAEDVLFLLYRWRA